MDYFLDLLHTQNQKKKKIKNLAIFIKKSINLCRLHYQAHKKGR